MFQDTDHSGALTISEFEEMLHTFNLKMSRAEMLTFMRCLDTDGDGRLSYQARPPLRNSVLSILLLLFRIFYLLLLLLLESKCWLLLFSILES